MRNPLILLFAAIPCLPAIAQDWRLDLPHSSPTAARGAAMAYDGGRARAVLFGGCDVDYPASAISGASAQTWEWEGGEWVPRATQHAPSARFYHAMTYDSVRHRVVLFGGRDAVGTNPPDVWEYDGTDWADVTPLTGPAPSGRELTGFVYDGVRQVCVLFGGGPFQGPGHYDDTWTWNGAVWVEQAPAHRPTARFGHAMAYDDVHQRVLLFAGTIDGNFVNDLWQWDGSDWTEVPVVGARPVPRHYHGMAYDPTRDELLVFGGDPGGYLPPIGDTWVFHDGAWTERAPAAPPTNRRYPAVVFDRVRHEAVLFGGQDLVTGANGNPTDTWTYGDGGGWFGTFGSGCGGAYGVPEFVVPPISLPSLGQPFVVGLQQLPPLAICAVLVGLDITGGAAATFPRDLTPLGFPGCTQWVDPFDTRLLLGVGGAASLDMTVPNDPLFAGLHVYFQAAAWDSTAPAPNPGLTTSGAGCATLGS